MLDSVDTVEEAIDLTRQVIEIQRCGGFEIRNWISNSVEVLHALNSNNVNGNLLFDDKELLQSQKVLGMLWCTKEDEISYSVKFFKLNADVLTGARRPTKREVLRTLMSVFEPLSFLAAFLVYCKILLQEIWRSSVEWDDKISDPQFQKWLF